MDRHGRVRRTDPELRRRPATGYRMADGRRFTQLARASIHTLGGRIGAAVAAAELVVLDVPPSGEGALLAEYEDASGPDPARLTLYRRPLELRAESKLDLVDLLREVVRTEVGDVLGFEEG